nr:MAG TPA: hypothetical protein [Caudoviricetes sp.]
MPIFFQGIKSLSETPFRVVLLFLNGGDGIDTRENRKILFPNRIVSALREICFVRSRWNKKR